MGSAKNSLVDGSKALANKAFDTSKRILESEQVQNLKESAVSKYQQITDTPKQVEQNTKEFSDATAIDQSEQAQIDQSENVEQAQTSSKAE